MNLKGFEQVGFIKHGSGVVFITVDRPFYAWVYRTKEQKRLKTRPNHSSLKLVVGFSETKYRLLTYSKAWLVRENADDHPIIMKIVVPKLYK